MQFGPGGDGDIPAAFLGGCVSQPRARLFRGLFSLTSALNQPKARGCHAWKMAAATTKKQAFEEN